MSRPPRRNHITFQSGNPFPVMSAGEHSVKVFSASACSIEMGLPNGVGPPAMAVSIQGILRSDAVLRFLGQDA